MEVFRMTQDIVDRLRMLSSADDHLSRRSETEREAADTIAALRAEVETARELVALLEGEQARAERAEAELTAARATRAVKVKPLDVSALAREVANFPETIRAHTIAAAIALENMDVLQRLVRVEDVGAYIDRILAALTTGDTDDRA
jgi:hypothetical protein